MNKYANLCFASSLLLAQGVGYCQSDSAIQSGEQDYKSAVNAIGKPLFNQAIVDYQRQAAAITQSAIVNNTDTSGKALGAVVNNPQINELSKQLLQTNASDVASVGKEQIKQAQLNLPKIDSVNGFGQDIVVSSEGASVLSLIKKLPTANPQDTSKTIQTLQAYAKAGNPEALTFMAWVLEYGLFGAKSDMTLAMAYYQVAAQKGYATAAYDLATIYYFGKGGIKQNIAFARQYAEQAAYNHPESSSRSCGLASFINYRLRRGTQAMQFSQECNSALAGLSKVAFGTHGTQNERIRLLSGSIATGANDGFAELENLARNAPRDKDLLFCKFRLLNQYRFNERRESLKEDSKNCYLSIQGAPDLNTKAELIERETRINSIGGFISNTVVTLASARASNQFRYGLSVPYLPFTQTDVDRFSKFLPKVQVQK